MIDVDCAYLRARVWPLTAAVLLVAGCAGGDPTGGFTSTPSNTIGSTSGDDGTTGNVTTFDADTDVQTQDGSGDTGPDPDTGDTGPDPDTTGPGDSTGPDDTTGPGCMPEAEVCDGMDNDCDGVPDNGDPGGGENCSTGMSGECDAGQTACEGGAVVCNPINMAVTEMCNNIDDDCDGIVDNGNPGGGGACNTGQPGACATGTNECQGGAIVCEPVQNPGVEACNNVDDDCDGQTDEGNPGGGGGCNTGLQGICSSGTNACVGGAIMCQQNQMAAPAETCGNNLDDDCNGAVDDGCGGGACPFSLCDSPGMPQVMGCDPCVDQVCAADPFCCSNQWDSICVGQVETVCARADCIDPACAHFVCDQGALLDMACHPCVASVCAADPFCCSNSWDGLCVGAVSTQCMLTCP